MHETQAPLARPRTAELGSSLQSSAEIVRPWGAGPDLDESPQTSSRGSGQLPASQVEAPLGHPQPTPAAAHPLVNGFPFPNDQKSLQLQAASLCSLAKTPGAKNYKARLPA